MVNRGKDSSRFIIEADENTHRNIISRGRVKLLDQQVRFTENFDPTKCYKCLRFGHNLKYCKNPLACANCGKEHMRYRCEAELKYIFCSKGKDDPNHSALDPKCPAWKREVEKVKSKTSFNRAMPLPPTDTGRYAEHMRQEKNEFEDLINKDNKIVSLY